MKLKTIFLLITCIVPIGCGLMKPSLPSPDKVNAALDKAIEKENPSATYTITNTKFNESGKYFMKEFKFTNFDFTDAAGKKRSIPSGRGEASFVYEEGKWKLTDIWVREPEIIPLMRPDIQIER